jgi:hypothetical protein
MPPWRGEGMTGTRALGLPWASGCWRWSCHPPRHLPEGGRQSRQPSLLRFYPASALDGPKVARPRCAAGAPPLTRRRADSCPPLQKERHTTQAIFVGGIDRPRSFRDDTQRNRSDQQHFSALGSAGGAEPCGDAQADLKRPLSPSGEVGGRSVAQNRRQKPVYPRKEAQTSRAESSPRSYRGRPPTLLSERNHLAVHAGLDLGSAVAEQGARASLASAGPGYAAVCSPSDLGAGDATGASG